MSNSPPAGKQGVFSRIWALAPFRTWLMLTAVIGGIFTRNTGRNLDQVPFFGDIPILGVLFQRRRASDTRNELVIFITPRIVNRAEALGR